MLQLCKLTDVTELLYGWKIPIATVLLIKTFSMTCGVLRMACRASITVYHDMSFFVTVTVDAPGSEFKLPYKNVVKYERLTS